MAKQVELEIVTREQAKRVADVMGESSAAASALRAIEFLGEDGENYEICRDVKLKTLVLIGKEYLADPRLLITNGERDRG